MNRPVTLIVSPKAGKGKSLRVLPGLIDRLIATGLDVQSEVTRSLEHATELAFQATAEQRVAVAVGGDGLTSRVVDAVARVPDACAAIVPAGTGNDFARALGIGSVDHALALLTTGSTRRVDLGMAGDRRFMCIASAGIDGTVVSLAARMRWIRGPLAYPLATLRALRRWRPVPFELHIDGVAVELEGYSVAVANGGSYGGGMWMAPMAKVDDGAFDVVAIGNVSRAGFLATAPKVFKGTHIDHPKVHVWRAQHVRLTAPDNLALVADGEVAGTLPADISVVPGALSVICPSP